MRLSRYRAFLSMGIVAMALSGCLVSVATIVIDAERERLADLERFEFDVAAQDCDGLSGFHSKLLEDRENLTDFDQRSDIVLDAMRRDGCALPEGVE